MTNHVNMQVLLRGAWLTFLVFVGITLSSCSSAEKSNVEETPSARFPSHESAKKGNVGTQQEIIAKQEADFRRNRSLTLAFADKPAFRHNRGRLLALVRSADVQHEYVHKRCDAELAKPYNPEVDVRYYCLAHRAPVVAVETVRAVLENLPHMSARQLSESTLDRYTLEQERLSRARNILTIYSRDPESIKQFREDPHALEEMLGLAEQERGQVPELLEREDLLEAWLAVHHASSLRTYVSDRLLGFETQIYQPPRPGQP